MDEDIPEIDVHEARERMERGAPLIDVREAGEYETVRIPGAKLLPMSEFMERYKELPKDQELMIQCRSGGRSGRITEALNQMGYRAVNVRGGILAWESAGLQVDSGEEQDEKPDDG